MTEQEYKAKNYGIVALVCGIVSLLGSAVPFGRIGAIVVSIVAIVFGVKGKRIAREVGAPTGMATAGIVLGIVSIVVTVLVLLAVILLIATGVSMLGSSGIQDILSELSNSIAI